MTSSRRRFVDHVLQLAAPRPVLDYTPAPAQLDDGIWTLDRRLRMPGGALLPARTVVVRLDSGGLAVISPPMAQPQTFEALDALGPVQALVAPNSFHYLFLSAFAARYPAAAVHVAPGLRERVGTLPSCSELSASGPPAQLAPALQQVVFGPVRGVSEVIFFHERSRTVMLADLGFNMIDLPRRFDRVFWRLSGVPREFGPSRTARMAFLWARPVARQVLARVLDWPFARIIVSHGSAVAADAQAHFRRAYAAYLDAAAV